MDLCAHRGAALSQEKHMGNTVQCPFHGIEYDKTGSATLIPANGRNNTKVLKRFNVLSYPVREKHDLIFL